MQDIRGEESGGYFFSVQKGLFVEEAEIESIGAKRV